MDIKAPDTKANCVLTSSIFDGYCLLCDCLLEHIGDIGYHVLHNMGHRQKMKQLQYMDGYEGDRICQVNHGYYCQFCNILMSTATKIAYHVAGPTHQHYKQVTRLQRLGDDVKTGDDVSVGKLAWHGLVGDGPGICAVCDKEYDNAAGHITEPGHVIKHIHSTVQFGPYGMLYRTVDEFSFQCLTCNMIFPLSTMYDHAWDLDHQTKYNECKKKTSYKTLTVLHIEDNGAPVDQLVVNKILCEYSSKKDETFVFIFNNIEYITQVDDTHEKYHEVLTKFKKSGEFTENPTSKNNEIDVPSDSANGNTASANGNTDSANGNTDSANGNTDSASGNTDSASGNTDSANDNTDSASGNTDSANDNTDSASGNTDSANDNTDSANNDKTEEETSEVVNKNEVKASSSKPQFGHSALNNTLLLLDTTTKKLLYFKYDNYTRRKEPGRVNNKNAQLEWVEQNIKKRKISKKQKPKKKNTKLPSETINNETGQITNENDNNVKGSNSTSQLVHSTDDLTTTTRTNLLSSYLCVFDEDTKRENPVSNDGHDGNTCNIVEETPPICESKNNGVANNDQIELPSDSSDFANNEKSDEKTAKLADDKNEASGSSDPTAKTRFTCEVHIITISEIAAPVDVKDKKCSDIVGETPKVCENTKNEDSTNSDCVNKDKTDEKTAKTVIKNEVDGSNSTSQLDITHPTGTIQESTTKTQSTSELDKISQSKLPAPDDSKDERCCDVLEEPSEICVTTKNEDLVCSKCITKDTDEKTAIVVDKDEKDESNDNGDSKIAEPVDSKDQRFPNIEEETPKTCLSTKNEDSASGNSDCVISEDKTEEITAIVVDKDEKDESNDNGDSKIAEPVDSKDQQFPNIEEETPKTCVSTKNEDSASGNSDCGISEDKTQEITAIVVDKDEKDESNDNGDSKIAEPVDSKDQQFPNIEEETPKTCVSTKNEDSASGNSDCVISEDKTEEITAIVVDKDEKDESNDKGDSKIAEPVDSKDQQFPNIEEETPKTCVSTKNEDTASGNSDCVISEDKTDDITAIVVDKDEKDESNDNSDNKIAEPVDSIREETPKTCVSTKNEDSASGNSDCAISEDKTEEKTAIVAYKDENVESNDNSDSQIAEPVDSKDQQFSNIEEESPKTCVSTKNEDSASGNGDCVISKDKTATVVDKDENDESNDNGDSKIAEPVDSKGQKLPNIEEETPKACVSTKNDDSDSGNSDCVISKDETDEESAIVIDKDDNDESTENSQIEDIPNVSYQDQATETPLIPKQNTQEMSTQTEDNKKPNIVKIFDSIPEFESQGICVNLEMSTVFCTLCTKYLLFEYEFIKKHIKEHELNIVEENLRRTGNGEGNNGSNNNLIYFVNDITVQSLGNRFKRFKQLGKSDWPSLMDEYYNDDILSSILHKTRHSPTYASSPKAKDMMDTLININSDVPLKSPLKERNSNVNQSPAEKKPTFKEMESVIQKISDLLDDDLYSVSKKDTNIQISTDTKAPKVNTKLSVRVTNKKKWFVTPDIELPPICKKMKMLKEKENISPTGEINKHLNTLSSEISNINDVNNKKTLSPKNVTTSLLPKMNNVQSPPASSKDNIQQKYSQYSLNSNGHPSSLPNEAKTLLILKENPSATNETSSEKPATVASNVNTTLHNKQCVERLSTSRAANDQMMPMNKICRERRIASEYKASMNGRNINVPSRSNLKRSDETEEITHHIPLMLNGISYEDPFTAEQFMDAIAAHLNNRKIVKTSSTSNESDHLSGKDQSVVMQPNPERICESIALTGNDDKTTLSQRPNEKCLRCVTDMKADDSQQSSEELDSETSLSTDSDSSSESIDTTPSSTKSKLSTSNERIGRTRRSSTPIGDARSTSNEKNADEDSTQSDSDSAKSSVKSEDGCADFAAANGLTYNACNRNAYCPVCNARIPSSMKNFREHVAGAIHKSRAAIPPSKRVGNKFTLLKQTMAEFVDSKLVVTDCHVDDVVINEKYCLTRLSYYMITKTTAVRHRCHLCEMNVLTSRLDDHLRKQGHDRAVDEVNVVCSPDEMFREVKPEIYHCGYCNQIVGKWDQVMTHVKTSDHKSWKGQALSRIRGYHAAALEDHRNIRERKHKTMVMLGLCE